MKMLKLEMQEEFHNISPSCILYTPSQGSHILEYLLTSADKRVDIFYFSYGRMITIPYKGLHRI